MHRLTLVKSKKKDGHNWGSDFARWEKIILDGQEVRCISANIPISSEPPQRAILEIIVDDVEIIESEE